MPESFLISGGNGPLEWLTLRASAEAVLGHGDSEAQRLGKETDWMSLAKVGRGLVDVS